MRTFERTHPWINFQLNLRPIEYGTWLLLGEAVSKTEHIAGVPLLPEAAQRLHQVFLAKGALATTAILNSTWSAALAAATADEARGGYRRINARVVGSMPTVAAPEAQSRLAALSTEAQRSRHVSQSDIDEAVATALALPRSVQDRLRSITIHHG